MEKVSYQLLGKDQDDWGFHLFYAVLYPQSFVQCLAHIDWMQFMATTSGCDWGLNGDKARTLQEDPDLLKTWLFSPLSDPIIYHRPQLWPRMVPTQLHNKLNRMPEL